MAQSAGARVRHRVGIPRSSARFTARKLCRREPITSRPRDSDAFQLEARALSKGGRPRFSSTHSGAGATFFWTRLLAEDDGLDAAEGLFEGGSMPRRRLASWAGQLASRALMINPG